MFIPPVVKEVVKENPLKSLAATVAAASVLIGAVITVDTRYAHAGDIQAESNKQQRQIYNLQADNLSDKVFELELKKANTPKLWQPTDQVMLERYKQRYQEVDKIRSMPVMPKDAK